MKERYNIPIGFSDHSVEPLIGPLTAVGLGATIIEKHFTLDKELEGPDHRASLNPEELGLMVREVRKVEFALGDGRKIPTASELVNQSAVRKSLYAKVSIKAGDCFTIDNLISKRPQIGISPMEYWKILGKVSQRSYAKDEQIR